jgi:hypothetical protein
MENVGRPKDARSALGGWCLTAAGVVCLGGAGAWATHTRAATPWRYTLRLGDRIIQVGRTRDAYELELVQRTVDPKRGTITFSHRGWRKSIVGADGGGVRLRQAR